MATHERAMRFWIGKSKAFSSRKKNPVFYVYRQTFKDPVTQVTKNRFALLGRVRLEPFEKAIVVPHEKTLRGPKEDRMRLLKTVQTNFSLCLAFIGSGFEVRSIIQDPMNSIPVFEAEDDDKITHTLWTIEDPDILAKLHKIFQSKKIYIADGHHRMKLRWNMPDSKERKSTCRTLVLFPFDYMYHGAREL